ncbi:RDD family protein [Campylobacter hominis]|uniref:RDD family protein n=1 Tax=Campylobacter hominis TaxID=76517 RepID=UPI00248C57A3|nr:RDD family protein [Campylobacter hominis]
MLKEQNFTIASNAKRIISFGIDELLMSFLFFAIYSKELFGAPSKEAMIAMISALSFQYYLIKTIYHTFFIYKFGATLGKYLCKIRCVCVDGNMNFSAALLRATVRILSEFLFYIGFVWALFDPYKQTWQDKVAKTLVVNVE